MDISGYDYEIGIRDNELEDLRGLLGKALRVHRYIDNEFEEEERMRLKEYLKRLRTGVSSL